MRNLPSIFTSPAPTLPPLRKLPPRPRVPFFKLASHTLPTKWSVYRHLIRYAPDSLHREAARSRWRRPRKWHCTSPHLTMRLLQKEEQVVKDYKELHCLRLKWADLCKPENIAQVQDLAVSSPCGLATVDEAAIPPEDAEVPVHEASPSPVPYYLHQGLQDNTSARLESLQQHIDKLHLDASMSNKVTEEYHTSLEQARAYYRPIKTPGMIFPSMRNVALPRLKPQPLHMTMLITNRQRARDRRIIQLKTWEEMQMHIRLEQQFDGSTGSRCQPEPDEYVAASAAQLKRSDAGDMRRLNTKFPAEILPNRDGARRLRPAVLTAQRRKRDTAARLQRISQASKRSREGDD